MNQNLETTSDEAYSQYRAALKNVFDETTNAKYRGQESVITALQHHLENIELPQFTILWRAADPFRRNALTDPHQFEAMIRECVQDPEKAALFGYRPDNSRAIS